MPETRLDTSKSFKIFSKNIAHSYLGEFHDFMIYDSKGIHKCFFLHALLLIMTSQNLNWMEYLNKGKTK